MAAKKQKRGRYLPTTYNLTKQARELLLTLIANMIGDKNRIPDMGATRVLPEMIPVSDDDRLLNAARTVLQLMYRAAENGVPPTHENILNGLALELQVPQVRQLLETAHTCTCSGDILSFSLQ